MVNYLNNFLIFLLNLNNLGALSICHCELLNRIIRKSEYYHDKFVLEVTEEFTSKTCHKCGSIHHQLGSNEIFVCPNSDCGGVFSRDPQGSYNVSLKKFTEIIKKKN